MSRLHQGIVQRARDALVSGPVGMFDEGFEDDEDQVQRMGDMLANIIIGLSRRRRLGISSTDPLDRRPTDSASRSPYSSCLRCTCVPLRSACPTSYVTLGTRVAQITHYDMCIIHAVASAIYCKSNPRKRHSELGCYTCSCLYQALEGSLVHCIACDPEPRPALAFRLLA